MCYKCSYCMKHVLKTTPTFFYWMYHYHKPFLTVFFNNRNALLKRSSVFRSPGSVTSLLTLRDLQLDDKAGRTQVAVSFVLGDGPPSWQGLSWSLLHVHSLWELQPDSVSVLAPLLVQLLLQVWKWHRETFHSPRVVNCVLLWFPFVHYATWHQATPEFIDHAG